MIYCHTTMWGNDGPRATWPGFDQLAQSSCGLEQELGGEGNGPNWYRFGMCDQACAVQSALAVLMALYWRERTGEGQLVDTSIVNGGVHLNTDAWIGPDGLVGAAAHRPAPDRLRPALPALRDERRLARARVPRRVALGALAKAVPGLEGDARFADRDARRANAATLAEMLGGFVAARTTQAAFDLLDGAGVPVEMAPEDARRTWLRQPDLVAAGLVADYEHPQYGRFRQFGHLVNLSDTPGKLRRTAAAARPALARGARGAGLLRPTRSSGLRERGVTLWPD